MDNLEKNITIISPFSYTFQYSDNRLAKTNSIIIGVEYIESMFTYKDTVMMQNIYNAWMPEINRFLNKDNPAPSADNDDKSNTAGNSAIGASTPDGNKSNHEDKSVVKTSSEKALVTKGGDNDTTNNNNSNNNNVKKDEYMAISTKGARLVLVDDSQQTSSQRPLVLMEARSFCKYHPPLLSFPSYLFIFICIIL